MFERLLGKLIKHVLGKDMFTFLHCEYQKMNDKCIDQIKQISTQANIAGTVFLTEDTELDTGICFYDKAHTATINVENVYNRCVLWDPKEAYKILKYKPKSVTMFLDTCYSGVSRDEKTLLASARPIRISVKETNEVPENFTIFTASQLDQISSGLKEAKHGIFSYYLMKGLEGNADTNQDNKITSGELIAYMDENVSQKAAEQGREQNPSLSGDPDKVLMSYR